MKKVTKIIALLLAALAALSMLAACGESDAPETTKLPKKTTVTTSGSEAQISTPDSGEDVVYKLPAGAESEYALYKTVVDYLNNGFHFDDLKDVYDPILTAIAIYTRPADFALNMRYDELCALLVKLRGTWSKIETMMGTYEDFDEFCDAFRSEFPGYLPDGKIESDAELEDPIYKLLQDQCPESMQAEINEDRTKFEKFIDAGVFHSGALRYFPDGQNPYYTDQTVWEKIREDELVISEFEYDDEEYENSADSFPTMYFMGIGEYRDEYIHEMEILYTEIEGRYYLISFTGAVLNAGG